MFLFETLLQILSVSTLVSLPRHAPTINKILPGGSFHILNSRYPYQFFSLGKEEKNQKPKAVVLIHPTSYDGAVELAAMQMEIERLKLLGCAYVFERLRTWDLERSFLAASL